MISNTAFKDTEGGRKHPEKVQKKLYFLNEQLQDMVRQLPTNLQQKFPNELLCSLAESLVDDTIYNIVIHLMDIQHYAEKQLFHRRLILMKEHAAEMHAVRESHLPKTDSIRMLRAIKDKYRKKYIEFDKSVIEALDEKKRDQQGILVMADIPGFEITDDPGKIFVQTKLIDFILRLSQVMINWAPKS